MRTLLAILLLAVSAQAQAVGGKAAIGGTTEIGGGPVTVPNPTQTPAFCGSFSVNPSCTATFVSNANAGDTLVAGLSGSSGVTISAPTGCVSSWASVNSDATTNQSLYIGTVSSTGSCAVTVNGTDATATSIYEIVYELSNTIATVDQSAFRSVAFCNSSCSGPTITNTVNGDINLVFVFNGTGNVTGFNSPYSGSGISINGSPSGYAYHVLAVAGADNATWTSAGGTYVSAAVSVKP